jgi:hypothetical protein
MGVGCVEENTASNTSCEEGLECKEVIHIWVCDILFEIASVDGNGFEVCKQPIVHFFYG